VKPPKKTSRIRWGKGKWRRTPGTGGRRFPGSTPGPDATSTPPPGGGRTRRSPFESAAHTAPTTYTVTSDHVPGSTTKRWEPDALTTGTPALPATGPAALDAAPTKTFPRPGTSRPKEPIAMPPAPPAGRRVSPRPATRPPAPATTSSPQPPHGRPARNRDHPRRRHRRIRDFKADAFKTHDQCFKLADRAINLRDASPTSPNELAVENNLIGALFTGAAMARFASPWTWWPAWPRK
jgi:hypothetical protein